MVWDPKGLTNDECIDVLEIRIGGSYLDGLKEFKDKKADLESIELHFLSKDAQEVKKVKIINIFERFMPGEGKHTKTSCMGTRKG